MVADFGDGIKIIWTPAVDPKAVLGIPALQGVTLKPAAWVFPPGEKADQILINPAYPPDYQDAIVWFPDTDIQPIYISLSVMGGHAYHPAPKGLAAFPDVVKADAKTKVQGGGGLRKRWKDHKGRIYEWDSQHGAVEIYDKQGKHLGEFNPETGEQTKPAKPGRKVEK
ncbi:Colicin-E3 [compost metagenome]